MKKYLLAGAAAMALSAPANALTFVGSWDVFHPDAPVWTDAPPDGPLAYTGQEAAALLFGGNASDYVISTIDDQVANINNMAWYDVIGFGQNLFTEDYNQKHLGQFYGPTNNFGNDVNTNAASAFIRDNLQGNGAINFAFRINNNAIPEPATWAMLIVGFGLVGGALRRRKTTVKVSYA